MGRESNRGEAPHDVDAAVHTPELLTPEALQDGSSTCEGSGHGRDAPPSQAPLEGGLTSWFDLGDDEPPRPEARPSYAIAALGVAALLCAAFARSILVRTLLPLALAAAAIAIVARRRAASPRQRPAPRAARGLSVGDRRLALYVRPSDEPIFVAEGPFGVTLLASRGRERVVAAITYAGGAFFVGATFDEAARRTYASLLDRTHAMVGDETALDAVGPDGEPVRTSPAALAALVERLGARDPGCWNRLLLTDARGRPVTLEDDELRVRDARVDLSAPLEWRPIVFQEAFGPSLAVYQGTVVRQGGSELVLVSLLPASSSFAAEAAAAVRGDGGGGGAQRSASAGTSHPSARGVRLASASPEPAPAPEQRVAVDRLFMLPLRAALDRAPRASQQPSRARPS